MINKQDGHAQMIKNTGSYVIILFTVMAMAFLQACSQTSETPIPTSTVTTNTDANGALSPTSKVVAEGETASFTVNANDGFILDAISGCGGTLDGTTYTTEAISADCEVSASFIPQELTVAFDVGPNGDIAGGAVGTIVNWGDTIDIAITPDATYAIDTVTGCNGTLSGNTYTAGPITNDCTLSVSFSFVLGSVSPFYNTNGQKWNDYVKNDTASIFTATDAAADGTETGGYSAVLHGGKMPVRWPVAVKSKCRSPVPGPIRSMWSSIFRYRELSKASSSIR